MPEPDLKIRGAVFKRFFRPFGPQFGLKTKGGRGAGPPGFSLRSATVDLRQKKKKSLFSEVFVSVCSYDSFPIAKT